MKGWRGRELLSLHCAGFQYSRPVSAPDTIDELIVYENENCEAHIFYMSIISYLYKFLTYFWFFRIYLSQEFSLPLIKGHGPHYLSANTEVQNEEHRHKLSL